MALSTTDARKETEEKLSLSRARVFVPLMLSLNEQGSVTRNLKRSRDMGNTSLEETERQRGRQAIAAKLNQLNEAIEAVGDKADTKKKAVDSARNYAEVRNEHDE